MRTCIYCFKDKPDKDFTLEHVIPQFLGGAYAPDIYKTRHVCGQCNSNLGLFVDAAFEKNWWVSHALREASYAFFDPQHPTSLPLICMGASDLTPPEMREEEVCESWLGPLGEQIYWVRPRDERLYWYVGGNPRTAKKVKTRAYFLFSERSNKNITLSWFTFRDAFEGRPVKKVMCTDVDGASPSEIGFSLPDRLDEARIDYFRRACVEQPTRHIKLPVYIRYDFRFMAKIALGMSYSLFGEKILNTTYTTKLQKALWHREGDEVPNINGVAALNQQDDFFKDLTGEKNAVTVMIMPSNDGIAINLNIGSKLNWTVKCASFENLSKSDVQSLEGGIIILLYKNLQRGLQLPLPSFIAHKGGVSINKELNMISEQMGKHLGYFQNL